MPITTELGFHILEIEKLATMPEQSRYPLAARLSFALVSAELCTDVQSRQSLRIPYAECPCETSTTVSPGSQATRISTREPVFGSPEPVRATNLQQCRLLLSNLSKGIAVFVLFSRGLRS